MAARQKVRSSESQFLIVEYSGVLETLGQEARRNLQRPGPFRIAPCPTDSRKAPRKPGFEECHLTIRTLTVLKSS